MTQPGRDKTLQPDGQMGILDHLRELRSRLLKVLAAVFILSLASWFISDFVLALLNAPFYSAFPTEKLIGTGPAEAFMIKLKVCVFTGVMVSMPFMAWQLWLFVAPGLYEKEKRLVLPFVTLATILFSAGVIFCYTLILPAAFTFFREQYASISLSPAVRLSELLSTSISVILAFGLVFELPVVAWFLGRLGVINDRMLIDNWRVAVVIIFIVAAVLTPPDVMSQFLMAGPLILLYGISILIVKSASGSHSSAKE